jgi:hypothetical protein
MAGRRKSSELHNKEITDKLNVKNSKSTFFIIPLLILCSDISVGIAMGYRLDSQGSIPGRGIMSRPALGLTQPPI